MSEATDKVSGMTFGLELEWADVDRRISIPETLGSWDFEDYTIVNSNGRANDPTGAYSFGGEINTRPTETPMEQAHIASQLADLLKPTINYRCNLHVHVAVPGLAQDLELIKQVATYFRYNERFVFETIEPIPKPTSEEYPNPEELKGAMKRYRRRLVSHHYSLPEVRYQELLNSSTLEELYSAHAPLSKSGRRQFQIAPRPAMNLRSLFKNGTIEFRHFPGTANWMEIESAVSWCKFFVIAAITDFTPAEQVYGFRGWTFPEFRPYIHELELGYQETKFKK
jgi:hypothetical protein